MRYFLITVCCWLVSFQTLSAQNKPLTEDPTTFGDQVYELLKEAKTDEAKALGKLFDSLWVSGVYDQRQQQVVMQSAIQMEQENFKLRTHFLPYFEMLTYAHQQQLTAEQMQSMLEVTQKVIGETDHPGLENYLVTLRDFFYNRALYASNFHSLYAREGSFSFEYVEPKDDFVAEEPPAEEEQQEEQKDDGWFSDWDEEEEGEAQDDDWSSDWGSWEDEEEEEQEAESTDALLSVLPEVILPEIKGAVIHLTDTKLQFENPYDTVALTQTSGTLLIQKGVFVGENGRFDWSPAGFSADSVYVSFEKGYSFEVNKPRLDAERVMLTYEGKIAQPVEGVFSYESKAVERGEAREYPRFKSYESNVQINNLGAEDLVYKGGFSLRGARINSSSLGSESSMIKVLGEGRPKFIAHSKRFTLGDSLISALRTAVVIYQDEQDSIYHPAVQLKYNKSARKLLLIKDEGGYKDTPYNASYYDMEISADMLEWFLDADSMNISVLNARNQVPATFISRDYYDGVEFNRLSGMYGFHPLLMVVSYAKKVKSKTFYLADMVEKYKQNFNTVEGAVVDLMRRNFVDYNKVSREVTIKRKALHYVAANRRRKDYDDLMIPSIGPSGPNATLNLKNNELTVRGIDRFNLSEKLKVYIRPDNNEITLLNNRDFKFDGRLFSGNMEFKGSEFLFEYDQFLVDMSKIDTIKFHISTAKKDRNNNRVTQSLENQMVETSGTLYIDRSDNKASVKDLPEYPRFSATKGGRVYFDQPEVLDGAYDKTVYFDIPPFELDSMSDESGKAIGFKGTMVTGGIFPEFDEVLVVMPDRSLGFEHKIPENGYALYQGSATAYNELKLDNSGLKLNGKMDYLTTTLESDNFTFYMDSVTTTGTVAKIEEGVLGNTSFPQAYVEEYRMKWLPYQDSLKVTNLSEPFKFYSETASMEGTAIITQNGVHGEGVLKTRGSESVSDSLSFKQTMYSARHADFEVKSDNPSKAALKGQDVALVFDLAENVAEISPERQGIAAIDFPYAQMKTSISKATWNLEDKTVRMSKPQDVDISNSYFYSTREELDSLAFNAEEAIYDINQLKLNVYGIPHIKVADALVIPENHEVLVLENSKIQEFTNATLKIDTTNGFHTMYNGNINVLSRKKFEGSAIYQFVNSVNDTFALEIKQFDLQPVTNRWGRTRGYRTVSSARVLEEDELVISPGMIFQGKVTMYAEKKPLELDGYVKLDFENRENYDTWIAHRSDSAENQEVVINYDQALTKKGSKPVAGLYFENNVKGLYSIFIDQKRRGGDVPFFDPAGLLSYNLEDKEYIIEQPKEKENALAGKRFTYKEESGEVTFKGPVDFIDEPEVSLRAAAKGEGNAESNEYKMNAMMAFDFDLPGDAYESMSLDMLGVIERLGAPQASRDLTAMLYKLADLEGNKTAEEFEELSLEDYATLPEVSRDLGDRIVLTDIDMKWSPEQQAWYSTGKIGLSNVNRYDVNARFDGFLEVKKHPDGDKINLFIQASPGSWYYISYEGNRSYVFASNEEFNSIIQDKSKITKAKPGEYVFVLSDIAEATTFVNRFRMDYFGIDTPYQLEMPMEDVVNMGAEEEEEYETIQPVNYTEEEQPAVKEEEEEEEDDDDGF